VSGVPELTTERLLLRGWRPEDRAPFAAMNADPEVMRHVRGPMTRAESDTFADRIEQRWAEDGHGLWVLEHRGTGEFLGFAGLARQTFEAPFNPSVEVGWRLVPTSWGNGYATEAGAASVAYGFEQLGLAEIVSITTARNERSMAVMRRLGMTRDPADDFEQQSFPPGHPLRAAVLHRLGRERWAAQRS
jgi:RimJ/RimL family protein N-acetyltransferase